MKKVSLRTHTIIAFISIFVIAVILMGLGGDVLLCMMLLPLLAAYPLYVSTRHFIQCRSLWIAGEARWFRQALLTYVIVLVFAASMAFFALRPPMPESYPSFCERCLLTITNGPQFDLKAALDLGRVFLFAAGVALFVVGCKGPRRVRGRSGWYHGMTFLTAAVFAVIGAVPAFQVLVLFFWMCTGASWA